MTFLFSMNAESRHQRMICHLVTPVLAYDDELLILEGPLSVTIALKPVADNEG